MLCESCFRRFVRSNISGERNFPPLERYKAQLVRDYQTLIINLRALRGIIIRWNSIKIYWERERQSKIASCLPPKVLALIFWCRGIKSSQLKFSENFVLEILFSFSTLASQWASSVIEKKKKFGSKLVSSRGRVVKNRPKIFSGWIGVKIPPLSLHSSKCATGILLPFKDCVRSIGKLSLILCYLFHCVGCTRASHFSRPCLLNHVNFLLQNSCLRSDVKRLKISRRLCKLKRAREVVLWNYSIRIRANISHFNRDRETNEI